MLTETDRLALARAVTSSPVGRPLERDNRAGAPADLKSLVVGGGAFFVVPRSDLVVVDLDLPFDPGDAARRVRAFDDLVDAARACGVGCVVVDSGSGGHRHAYVVTGHGVVGALLAWWCARRGLDVRRRGVRPPGAPHRDGVGAAALVSPTSPFQAVRVLTSSSEQSQVAAMVRRLGGGMLSADIRAAVDQPDGYGKYPSASEVRMAVACSLYAQGGDRAMFRWLLDTAGGATCDRWRSRTAKEKAAEVDRVWSKAALFVGSQSTPSAQVDAWRTALLWQPWRAESGANDVAVAEVLGAVAARVRRTRVGAAQADLAAEAGLTVATVQDAIQRLEAAGWLQKVAEASRDRVREYELVLPAAVAGLPAPRWARDGLSGGRDDLGADAFVRAAPLGKVAVLVGRAMGVEAVSVAELAQRRQMSQPSVRAALRALAAAGLATSSNRLWSWCGTKQAVETCASKWAVAGSRDGAREQVRLDRAWRRHERSLTARRSPESGTLSGHTTTPKPVNYVTFSPDPRRAAEFYPPLRGVRGRVPGSAEKPGISAISGRNHPCDILAPES